MQKLLLADPGIVFYLNFLGIARAIARAAAVLRAPGCSATCQATSPRSCDDSASGGAMSAGSRSAIVARGVAKRFTSYAPSMPPA